eukprot:TRINITY_DN47643_c0_g1_i1.p1 TRINITY_DN47643_c0_g1~~TRINITY_DN47643_c0_g1_i1.p1  ORF type:complete len:122 (+),score=22.91 TRINITY_DN47643_c0_g1_i1:442-807(+)
MVSLVKTKESQGNSKAFRGCNSISRSAPAMGVKRLANSGTKPEIQVRNPLTDYRCLIDFGSSRFFSLRMLAGWHDSSRSALMPQGLRVAAAQLGGQCHTMMGNYSGEEDLEESGQVIVVIR